MIMWFFDLHSFIYLDNEYKRQELQIRISQRLHQFRHV